MISKVRMLANRRLWFRLTVVVISCGLIIEAPSRIIDLLLVIGIVFMFIRMCVGIVSNPQHCTYCKRKYLTYCVVCKAKMCGKCSLLLRPRRLAKYGDGLYCIACQGAIFKVLYRHGKIKI